MCRRVGYLPPSHPAPPPLSVAAVAAAAPVAAAAAAADAVAAAQFPGGDCQGPSYTMDKSLKKKGWLLLLLLLRDE